MYPALGTGNRDISRKSGNAVTARISPIVAAFLICASRAFAEPSPVAVPHFLETTLPGDALDNTILPRLRRGLEQYFHDPKTDLYAAFHVKGSRNHTDSGFFDYPRNLPHRGSDSIAMFNALVGDAELFRYKAMNDPDGLDQAGRMAEVLLKTFTDSPETPLRIFNRAGSPRMFLNDVLVASFLAHRAATTGLPVHLAAAGKVATRIRLYRRGNSWSTWRIGNKWQGDLSPREALSVPALAYLSAVLGNPEYLEWAEEIADTILRMDHASAILKKIPHTVGTDAELGMGLLELHAIKRDPARLAQAKSLSGKWNVLPTARQGATADRATGTVDLSELILLNLKLHSIEPGNGTYPARAHALITDLESCFSEEYKAFPISCGRDPFYLAFNAIILNLYQQRREP